VVLEGRMAKVSWYDNEWVIVAVGDLATLMAEKGL
jgi:hypothetical protein